MTQGLFNLQTPTDLFRKMEYDLDRMMANPIDARPAFDFFVTAHHLLDWIHPGDSDARRDKVRANALLQVCSHLANGSKHFTTDPKRHDSVAGTTQMPNAFSDGFSSGFSRGNLIVRLDGDAASQFGKTIESVAFAERVLSYWKTELKL